MNSNLIKNKIRFSTNCQWFVSLCLLMLLGSGCSKLYDVPKDEPYLSLNANFSITLFRPILGRYTLYSSIFNADNSNFPISFQIINVRNGDSTANTAFAQVLPVPVWKVAYTGLETSLQEIEAKRTIENHPIIEMLPGGQLVVWPTANNSNVLKSGIDSTYLFDVKISNSSGERIVKKLILSPVRERPYEPSYHISESNGAALFEANGKPKRLLPTTLSGMIGETTRRSLTREANGGTANVVQDVWVYFKRTGNGKSLTFKFMDKDSLPINPSRFNGTKWDNLIHGFNRQMTSQYVRYDVAYPIPLTKTPTVYTLTDGSQATLLFSYNRIGFNGTREVGNMTLNFNIFQEGDWEIVFFFHNETPKFNNE